MSDTDDCLWCGTPIDYSQPHAVKKIYCSRGCCMEHYHELEKQARLEAKQGRICKYCSGPICPTRFGHAIYCSDLCQSRANSRKHAKRYPLTCRICSRDFHGHRAEQLYCSNSCKGRMSGIVRRRKAAGGP